MIFEAIYSPRARWMLDHVAPDDYQLLDLCIVGLEHDPYPGPERRAPLVIPHERVYHDAFVCDGWRIAFHVEDDLFVVVDAIGREWPPIDPALRGGR